MTPPKKKKHPENANSATDSGGRQLFSFDELHRRVVSCERCPRLRRYCEGVAREKKREFRTEAYWGKPVPGFGDPNARIWIVGLAPGAHGANRTGRMFTGDSSGRWLFRALHRAGFCNQEESESREDGLQLRDIYISAAARCAPPDNKPLPLELERCSPFVDEEFRMLTHRKLFIALGSIGFHTILRLLQRNGVAVPKPRPTFGHGKFFELGSERILASYHPSRQNTQTGKLTAVMWQGIFDEARERLTAVSRS